MNHTIRFTEAQDDARHLTKVTGRDVEAQQINCTCDYSKLCLRCGGQGYYYKSIYSSCSHIVNEDNDDECDLNYCREQERARAEFEPVLKVEGTPLKSCREVASEQIEAA